MSGRSIRSVLSTTGHVFGDASTMAGMLCRQRLPALVSSTTRPPSSCQGTGRLLSTTAPRYAHAIDFLPSSSAELDAVLETIRLTILVPSYLRAEQRRQLFSPRHREKLRADPITLEIDGTVLSFTGMDLLRDMPNARAAARDAVGRMTTREDFDNLPRLLEGLHNAGRRLRPADYARIARRAGERGCIYAVIESARTVRRTGFRLQTSETVAEILTHVQLRAVDSGWEEAATRQALVWAEMVVDMLEDDQHGRQAAATTSTTTTLPLIDADSSATLPTSPPPPLPAFPLARDPQVLAARLHLAAMVATQPGDGADAAKDKVARYAGELVRLWPASKGLRSLHPAATYTDRRGEMHYLDEDNKFLGVAAPLLYGLDAAVALLRGSDGELATALQARRDALGAEVASALVGAPDRRGAAVYKKLFGEE
ncbi:hypothetical protein CMQ_4282 [Grosmannia clavigera kw1407]|uniref:Uncharacterized protein n=1 Tax=Grosmannia clavigera (strain kw1407 / UAMH 11150) TaxID=655863 RepID=F0XUE4_GROCL|nr:uncharacterized protein CMQ_4282 [Grosmannia clavigera kw1407]EFW98430.1 hypothetical protein CMQ_4282 [Grosmannia clavigera kw1407]